MPENLQPGAGAKAQKVAYSPYPCGVPLSMQFKANFAATDEYEVDLNNAIEQAIIDAVEGLFVDNSENAQEVIFAFDGTNQAIKCPANSQGYFPVLATNPARFIISSTGNGIVNFQVTNFPVPCHVWSTP